jgi:RNA polymerase sigma-70 factor (ECF subfamily)
MRRSWVRSGPPLDEVEELLSDRSPGPDRSAASEQTGRCIAEALEALSPKERAIVLLREVEGMPYDEIAQALQVPLGTLKASLHRSREKLRRALIQVGMTP